MTHSTSYLQEKTFISKAHKCARKCFQYTVRNTKWVSRTFIYLQKAIRAKASKNRNRKVSRLYIKENANIF